MQVLFISRATLFSVKGGDTVQVENTAAALRRLGIGVDIETADKRMICYTDYDLIHFFNITRPADIIYHIDKSRLPFLVSPIYLEYEETYQQGTRFINQLYSIAGKNMMEYLRCLGRWMKNGEKIMTVKYLLFGHRKSVAYILQRCDYLLPNSYNEYHRLQGDFKGAGAYEVVPNGVDVGLFHLKASCIPAERSVLCAARFEPRKNQLNLIRALNGTEFSLTLVGDIAPNHQDYYKKCRQIAGKNIRFLPSVDQQSLAALYRRHKVHILASWFETTGLCSLEAAACGCKLVVSGKGDTREYFSENAQYCDPADPKSIRSAVSRATETCIDKSFCEKIVRKYNWEQAGEITFSAYMKVLQRRSPAFAIQQ